MRVQEDTPELLPRDLPCHPGPYQPVVAAKLREVGCFQPFSAQSHQALFAGEGSPLPCSTAGVPSSPLGQHPSLAEGLGLPQFPPLLRFACEEEDAQRTRIPAVVEGRSLLQQDLRA